MEQLDIKVSTITKSSSKNHLNADLQGKYRKSSTVLCVLTYTAAKARSNKRDLLLLPNSFQVYSTCYPSLNNTAEEQADPLRCPTSRNKIHNHIKYWMISMTPIIRVPEHITAVWCILCHRAERKIWLPLCYKWEERARDHSNVSGKPVRKQGNRVALHGWHTYNGTTTPVLSQPDWTEKHHAILMIQNHTNTSQFFSLLRSFSIYSNTPGNLLKPSCTCLTKCK